MATRSRVKEMADAEAELAEAEDDDADLDADGGSGDDAPPDEVAGDPDAEPADDQPELSAEARAELFETALRLHFDNMAGFHGDDWQHYSNCPLCEGVGAIRPEDMVLDPTTQQCAKCRGWGQLVTEAVSDSHRFRQCDQCMGNGYVPRVEAPQPVVQMMTPGYASPNQNTATLTAAPVPIPPMPEYDPQSNTWRDPVTKAVLGPAAPAAQPDAPEAAVAP